MTNRSYTITTQPRAGRALTGHAPDAGSAHRIATHFNQWYPDAAPAEWVYTGPGVAELLVRDGQGPTHLALLSPGFPLAEVVVSCCGATLELAGATVTDPHMPTGDRGIPCPLCHTTWARRYRQAADVADAAHRTGVTA